MMLRAEDNETTALFVTCAKYGARAPSRLWRCLGASARDADCRHTPSSAIPLSLADEISPSFSLVLAGVSGNDYPDQPLVRRLRAEVRACGEHVFTLADCCASSGCSPSVGRAQAAIRQRGWARPTSHLAKRVSRHARVARNGRAAADARCIARGLAGDEGCPL